MSVMFDEASDINMHGNLNVFINILDPSSEVLTKTIALTEIESGDAESIYGKVMESLETSGLPLGRIVGLCSDGASTMLGCWRGVCTRLLARLRAEREGILHHIATQENRGAETFHKSRGVFAVHCVCHRLALVLTDAIKCSKSCDKVIPFECIDLMTTLFSYFSKSAKKKKELRDFIAHQNCQNPDISLTARTWPKENTIPNPSH